MSTFQRALRALVLTLAVTACGEEGTNPGGNNPPPPPGPAPVAVVQLGAVPAAYVGRTAQLTATAKDAQGNVLADRALAWASSAAGTATVNGTGLVTGVAAGPVTITVTSEGKTANAAITVALVPVSSISLTPGLATIKSGQDLTLAAVLKDDENAELPGRAVTWSSNRPDIATVDPVTGKVTAIAAGTAIITALSEGKAATAEITVIPVAVASVVVEPAAFDLKLGRNITIAAFPKDEAGDVLGGRAVTWSSSSPETATVDGAGKVTAVKLGQAIITATSDGKSGTATVTVVAIPVASVSLTPNTKSLKIDETQALVATARDENDAELPGRAFTFTTSNAAIATVSAAGVVTAVDVGDAVITATSEGKKATAAISVTAPVATVTITKAIDTLEAYDVLQLQVTLKDAKGRVVNGRPVEWTSSNPLVATVDGAGMLTGVDRGAVTVTATAEGKIGTVTRVVVIKYRSITAGTMHACDIASGGIVWCWGLNGQQGRIGSNDLTDGSMSSVPFKLPGNIRFTQLSAFARHTCGIAVGGAAYCWGSNGWGSLGALSNVNESPTPLAVAGDHKFKQVSVGGEYSCGLTTAGLMLCWGRNDWKQMGVAGNIGSSNLPVEVAGGRIFSYLSTGTATTCGIALDGSAFCWGQSGLGQVGDGGTISYGNTFIAAQTLVVGGKTFKSISVANQHTCALTPAGQAYCWGSNNSKFGNGPGNDASSPQAVSGGLTFKSLSAGFGHSCAIAQNGVIHCWGSNGNGQLGNAIGNGSNVPVIAAAGFSGAEVAAAGIGTGSGAHTCAISEDRLTVQCWGRNDFGQLGNGATTPGANANSTPSIVVTQKPLPKI